MIRWIGEEATPYVGDEGDELMLYVDKRHYTVCTIFLHGTVQDIPGFGKVVDTGVISPTVGGEDEGGYIVKLSVGGGALGVTGTVRLAAPGEVPFNGPSWCCMYFVPHRQRRSKMSLRSNWTAIINP